MVDKVLFTPATRMNRTINLQLGFPFLPTDVGYAGAVATGEVFGCLAQDMRSPVFASEIHANPALERRTRRRSCCSQGVEGFLHGRLWKGKEHGFPSSVENLSPFS